MLLTPSEFVALVNQTLEFAFPIVEVEGEVTNFRVSRNRWVYFDITDDESKVRCFGTVYSIPAPVEDGMVVRIIATPKLHPQFGFSLNFESLQFSGEGVIKKAADLLFAKLDKEGLFAPDRKRTVPYPPRRIALVTSAESAAYKDFVKVLSARYGGLSIELADVTVQGESAPGQLVRAIEWFNKQADIADVLVMIRGGGSADDLQAFSSEQVVRAVAASRLPTVVAIGHEVDTSLAELAADLRASTPSNAAELLVPDRRELLQLLERDKASLEQAAMDLITIRQDDIWQAVSDLSDSATTIVEVALQQTVLLRRTLEALSPGAILKRGYGIVRREGTVVRSHKSLQAHDAVSIELSDGTINAEVQ